MSISLLNGNNLAILSNAISPEDAAQLFMQEATKALAAAMAEALDNTLKKAVKDTAGIQSIVGWNDLVKGCALDICWERPKLGLPVGQVVAYADRQSNGVSALGVNVNVGVSISGTF